jgi:hypothetical protein
VKPIRSLQARLWRNSVFAASAAMALLLSSGCARVPIASQRLVSRPNMVFSDSMTFNDQRRLVGQIEPGSAFGGGAQASGCTACK